MNRMIWKDHLPWSTIEATAIHHNSVDAIAFPLTSTSTSRLVIAIMYLSPVALGAVVQRSTVEKGGKRRRLNSPTPPPPRNIFSLPTTPLRSPIPTERDLNRTPAPSTPPNLRLPDLPNPPQFYAMESDLSPDDAAKCTTGVLHLSSKRSMQHYHYWVMDKSILPEINEHFRIRKFPNSGGFDFISFIPYQSEDHYNQHHSHYAPLQHERFNIGDSVSGIMVSVLSLTLSLSLTHTLSLSFSIDFIRVRLFCESNHSGMPPTPILPWRRAEGGIS